MGESIHFSGVPLIATKDEVVEFLKVSPRTVYNLEIRREIRSFTYGDGARSKRYFLREYVERKAGFHVQP